MRVIGIAALVALGLVVATGRADAYPQFQLSTGTDTCEQCHFAPGGGGLINDYGRDEAGSTLSMREGNGGFLHGAWTPPEAFQIGVDLRGVAGFRHSPAPGGEVLAFPMQLEVYLRPKIGPVSLYVNAGFRPDRDGGSPGSREHYLMYENEAGAWYVRAGRFFPVFGVRTQDHTAYVRRHLQMYIYEEPYGVAWGKQMASSELHLSAFTMSPAALGTNQDSGVAAYYEKRNEESTAAYALQTRLSASPTDQHAWFGGVYKRWMESSKLMLLAELDLGVQSFLGGASDGDPRAQAIGYVSATYFAMQGLMLGGALQTYDPDLALEESSRNAAELNVQWLPMPHFELHLLGRVEALGLQVGDPVLLSLLQLHYYL